DGFGYGDTHETINSFLWGPDGWLYGNQGVFNTSLIGKPGAHESERERLNAGVWRYHPARQVFEVFAHGGSNQWGLDYDLHGQIFITHCRSFWGRGSTTHVMRGGHYWNQVNSGYAPFISAVDFLGLPHMRNYLLASARYGHGEGGAGKPGSRQVYGGHSHVGTMVYLGDNWPAEYRDHLFTHNLHGHQMNQQVNLREAGGYDTVHAGKDVLFCADQQYIGVDLQYGPDGAVYISDWYDPRHCHNPNVEQWDRGNGRMYRMKHDANWKPVRVDYTQATDEQLVEAQLNANDWHVRMARLVLSERAATGSISDAALRRLRDLVRTHPQDDRRLRALWTLYTVDQLDDATIDTALRDDSEYVRGWAVQLATQQEMSAEAMAEIVRVAEQNESLFVDRCLASAVQVLPPETAWDVAERVASHSSANQDRDLPSLLWYGVAQRMEQDGARAIRLSEATEIPALRDDILWYAARRTDAGREHLVMQIASSPPDVRDRVLALLALAVSDQRGLTAPEPWSGIAPRLYDSSDLRTRSLAELIGSAFGDPELLQRMRRMLADNQSDVTARKRAISVLKRDASNENVPLYLKYLDEQALTAELIPLLARSSDRSVADALITRLAAFDPPNAAAAMQALCSRVEWANLLLDAVTDGRVAKDQLTAFYARQIASLGDATLNGRLGREWGRFSQTSDERRAEIATLVAAYRVAPLWAYNAQAGGNHFKKLCANCHVATEDRPAAAPKLAGTGSKGIEYILENIIDPNAVIGRDFQARVIVTTEGRIITGLVEQETETAVTIRTLTDTVTIARSEVSDSVVSESSFMPEGLLKTLNDRERIELLKYLMGL
ncbi:MAG: hypothetical protein KDA75_13980, partial [Planctomycetaceae bacterium]|nr:hypothetical protein [Planctomycetaceae bacterium]